MSFPGARQLALTALLLLAMCARLRGSDCGTTQYDCAVYYVGHHQLDRAIESLNRELAQSPTDLKALNLLGIALTESGQVESANRKFQDALRLNPGFYPARKNLAVNQFHLQQLAQAATNFKKVLEQVPSDDIAQTYLGEIAFVKNDFPAALAHYQQASRRVLSLPGWTLHYAECLARKGEAERAFSVLQALPKDNASAQFQGGLILGRAGAFADAAKLFAAARQGYSDPYVAGYNQLLMLTRAGDNSGAIRVFEELQHSGYDRAELYNLVSDAYRNAGQFQQAYDALRAATRLEPAAEDNYVQLAALCLDHQDYDLGLQVLDVGTHYVPNSYRLYVQRGFMLVMRGRMADAEKEFQKASSIAPGKPLPYIALGEIWMQLGEAAKAADLLREKSKALEPNFLLAYVLAEALIRSGADAGNPLETEAVQALERSIRLNRTFPRAHAELGRILLKQGQIDRAIPELKIATELDPTDSGPFYQLGQAYRKIGNKDEANKMMARVQELHNPQREVGASEELRRLVKQDTSPSEAEAKP